MEISGGSFVGRSALSYPKVMDSAVDAIFEKKKKDKPSGGFGLPGQLSKEEQQKVDNLKNEAMQIAENSEGGLTAAEESRIKHIEGQIGKITKMPMKESLSYKTRKIAEKNQLEKGNPAESDKTKGTDPMEQAASADEAAKTGKTGMNILERKAMFTSLKLAGVGI